MKTLRKLLRKKKNRELKDSIRIMNSQRSDNEKKKICLKKVNNSLM